MTTRNKFDLIPDEIVLEIAYAIADILPGSRKNLPQLLIPPETKAFHALSQMDQRFHFIFTPFLYRVIVLRSSKARASFLEPVAPKEKLCNLVRSLWYEADRKNLQDEDYSQLPAILQALPLITNIKLGPTFPELRWKTKKKAKMEPLIIPQLSLPHLRSIDIHLLDDDSKHLAFLKSIVPQIDKVTVTGRMAPIMSEWTCDPPTYIHKDLKVLHLRWIDTHWFHKIASNELQEIDLDFRTFLTYYPETFNFEEMNRCRKPGRSLKSSRLAVWEKETSMKKDIEKLGRCYMRVGMFDRWRSSLKVLRVRAGGKIEGSVWEYLKQALDRCESGEISDPTNKIVKE